MRSVFLGARAPGTFRGVPVEQKGHDAGRDVPGGGAVGDRAAQHSADACFPVGEGRRLRRAIPRGTRHAPRLGYMRATRLYSIHETRQHPDARTAARGDGAAPLRGLVQALIA